MNSLQAGRILLLGSTGKLGKVLLRRLRDVEEFRKETKESVPDVVTVNRADIDLRDNEETILSKVLRFEPAVIINCAACNGPEWCEDNKDEARAVNKTAVGAMAKAAHRLGALFVHYSSDYAAADGTCDDLGESSVARVASNFYAQTKIWGEMEIQTENPCHLILRVSSLYGRDFDGPLDVLKQAVNGRGSPDNPIQVLHQRCSPIFIDYAVDMTVRLLKACDFSVWRKISGKYHLVPTGSIWKRDLAAVTLSTVFGEDRQFSIREGTLKIKRPIHCGLSNAKLVEFLKLSEMGGAEFFDPQKMMISALWNMDGWGLLEQFRK